MRLRARCRLLEDCAQAWGADFHGVQVGIDRLIGAYSFFPSKNIGCFGDGGLMTTDNADLNRSLRELRVHGQSGPYQHPVVGGNFSIDALQAAMLRVKLPHVGGLDRGAPRKCKSVPRPICGFRSEQTVSCRRRFPAAATPSINTWCGYRGGMNCDPSWRTRHRMCGLLSGSACTCSPVSRDLGYERRRLPGLRESQPRSAGFARLPGVG